MSARDRYPSIVQARITLDQRVWLDAFAASIDGTLSDAVRTCMQRVIRVETFVALETARRRLDDEFAELYS